MMPKKILCMSARVFTCAIILLLIIIGPVLIAIDLVVLIDWVNSLRMGDFYTYLAFIGIISLWSIYGFIMAIFKSASGFKIYTIGLAIAVSVQFFIGLIHIMLLFATYQSVLMDSCLQRQPTRLFWWSMGYEDNKEMYKIHQECATQWNAFARERVISWVVYTLICFICLFVITQYQQKMAYHFKKTRSIVMGDENDDWSFEKQDYFNERRKSSIVTYHQEEFPPPPYALPPNQDDNNNMANNEAEKETKQLKTAMSLQRQRLFDEIAKRKKARRSLTRMSITSLPPPGGNTNNRNSVLFHPLDLRQDVSTLPSNHTDLEYIPPPMPPTGAKGDDASWNRYNTEEERLLEEEHDRQRRLELLSAERIEYEMYRSTEPSEASTSRSNSLASETASTCEKKGGEAGGVMSHRRRHGTISRWSKMYTDEPTIALVSPALKMTPGTGTHEEEEEEEKGLLEDHQQTEQVKDHQ